MSTIIQVCFRFVLDEIKEKIGDSVIKNTIFISRINTQRLAKIISDDIDTPNDLLNL